MPIKKLSPEEIVKLLRLSRSGSACPHYKVSVLVSTPQTLASCALVPLNSFNPIGAFVSAIPPT